MRTPLALCAGAVLAVAGLAGTATPASAAVCQLPEPASSGDELYANVSASLTVSAEAVALRKAGEATASADLTGSIKVISD